MNKQSLIIPKNKLSRETLHAIDIEVERIKQEFTNNRKNIVQLSFDSIAALTVAKKDTTELANKGMFSRLIGDLSGSNKKLQSSINTQQAIIQEAGRKMLIKLAENNDLSFELIGALQNKLNYSMVYFEDKATNICNELNKFFNSYRDKLVRQENRLASIERNLDILNWQNSIEYLSFNGIEYRNLDDASKLLCLAKDFYEKTQGHWSTKDLLLLKTAMATIDIDPNKKINYFSILKTIATTPELKARLLDNTYILSDDDSSYLITMSTIGKIDSLQNEESYVVDTIADYLNEKGFTIDYNETVDNLTKKYMAENVLVNIDTDMKAYDFLVDLLFNLQFIESNKDELLVDDSDTVIEDRELPEELEAACKLFLKCNLKEAYPIFKQYAEEGNTYAMYFLSQYSAFAPELVSEEESEFWARVGSNKGNLLCKSVDLFYTPDINTSIKVNEKNFLGNVLKNRIDNNTILDAFYAYESICCLEDDNLEQGLIDSGYWKLCIKLGEQFGAGDNKDLSKALKYYNKALENGCNYVLVSIADVYFELKDYSSAKVNYEKYYELNFPLAGYAAYRMGTILDEEEQDKENAIKWYERAFNLGVIEDYSRLALYIERDKPNKALQLYEHSFEYLTKYAKNTDSKHLEMIAFKIGFIYNRLKDTKMALEWLKKSQKYKSDGVNTNIAFGIEFLKTILGNK